MAVITTPSAHTPFPAGACDRATGAPGTFEQRHEDIGKEAFPPWFALAVLRQVFGSPKTMCDQLDNLIELAGRQEIVIQVLRSSAADCAGAVGPMAIFDMPDGYQAVYVEGRKAGGVIEALDEVASLVTMFDLLRASALSPGESLQLIRTIRSEYGE
jgi:hypothetical protein